MPPPLKSALWAAVITTISGVILVAGAHAPVFTSAPWLAVLALPSLPGYVLAYFFQLGPNSEGIPKPDEHRGARADVRRMVGGQFTSRLHGGDAGHVTGVNLD